jgi:hypothetical protein
MPDSILLLAPLLVFALVVCFGFVGCTEDFDKLGEGGPPPPGGGDGPPEGHPPDGTPPGQPPGMRYQDFVIADGPIAYWRLGDSDLNKPAKDENGPDPGNHPGVFNASNFDLQLQQAGINLSDPTAHSALFDGGYVSVDVAGKPELATPAFTIEALVVADWPLSSSGQTPLRHVVVASHDPGALTGWALMATEDDHWQGAVWSGGQQYVTTDQNTLVPEEIAHLALTYDGNGVLTLYIDAQPLTTTGCQYTANTSEPISIGVGLGGAQPLFSFKGRIQEVALYQSALSATQVGNHYQANKQP